MKTILLLFLLLALSGNVLSTAGPNPDSSGLDLYLSHALNHSPLLASARAQTEAAGHAVNLAGALPDLKIGWGEMLVPVETRVGPQQRVFSIAQSFPWFGSLGQKSDVAQAQSDWAAWSLVEKQWAVAAAVRVAWTDLVSWQQEMVVIQDHLVLAKQQESTASAHFASGSGSFAHALRAQMAVVKVQQRLDLLKKRKRVLVANLNAASGFQVDRPFSGYGNLPVLEIRYNAVDHQDLSHFLMENNPSLKALAARKNKFNHEVLLAGMESKPNFTIGLDYIMTGKATMAGVDDSGKDPVIARVGVSLPLWSGRVAENKALQTMNVSVVAGQISHRRLELERLLEQHFYDWQVASETMFLTRDELLPSAKAILESENASYESGAGSFADIITAREDLLDLELKVIRLHADWIKADIGLEVLLGTFANELSPYFQNKRDEDANE